VWLEKGFTWVHPEGGLDPKESSAIGSTLYFGADGKFGMFEMNIVRTRDKMGLDEGDGGRIFGGQWFLRGNRIKVRYRLVDAYKLLLPPDQQPKVPGPVEEREMSIPASKSGTPKLQFEGKIYQPAPRIKASSLRQFLDVYDKQKG
jgi:hypothetical protein